MVPTFDEFILPTLQFSADGKQRTLDEVRVGVCKMFNFSDADLEEKTRSGHNTKVNDRITWSLTYLCQAGLAERQQRATAVITFSGLELLENPPKIITRNFLYGKYPSFKVFHDRKKGDKNSTPVTSKIRKPKVIEVKADSNQHNLEELRNAMASLVNLGIEPTPEMYLKEKELLAKIYTDSLFPAVANALIREAVDDRFVLFVKYDRGNIFLKYDTEDEALNSFPEDATLYQPTSDEDTTTKRKRRPNLNFHQMGLIEGDVLIYASDESIQVTVASENKVEYNGKEYSLTRLTQELKGLTYAIKPTGEWTFDGQNMQDIYNDTYTD